MSSLTSSAVDALGISFPDTGSFLAGDFAIPISPNISSCCASRFFLGAPPTFMSIVSDSVLATT